MPAPTGPPGYRGSGTHPASARVPALQSQLVEPNIRELRWRIYVEFRPGKFPDLRFNRRTFFQAKTWRPAPGDPQGWPVTLNTARTAANRKIDSFVKRIQVALRF